MYQAKRNHIFVFIAVLAFNLAIAGNAAAIEITVNNSTGQAADFTSIQAAVNAANPDDEIIVRPGIYEENIEIYKTLTIFSESGNPSDTIIQAADSSRDVFGIWANEVSIKGFSITKADSAAGVHVLGVSDCHIEHNIFSNNSCGIDLYIFSSGNTLVDNDISDSFTGISLGGGLNNTLRNNSISYCESGISLFDSSSNKLENNTVSENNEGVSLTGESIGNTLVSNILKSNTQVGLRIREASSNLIYNNYLNNSVNMQSELVTGENIWNTTRSNGTSIVGGPYLGGNFWGRPDGTVYPRGVRDIDLDGIFDSMYDIEDSGSIDYLPLIGSKSRVITVSNSEDQNANFTSIQAAVNSTYPGDTILVYPGVYVENVGVDVENLVIISASNNSSDTIIQATNSSKDIFSVTADGVGIKGFNITGNISFPNAGIHLYEAEDCRIENNEFFNVQDILQNSSGNYTSGNGSNLNSGFGICLDSSGNNTLNNNTVSYSNVCILLRNSNQNILLDNRVSNSNYGIWANSSSDNVLTNNAATNNNIGIYLKASSRNTVTGSILLNNSGSCINLWDSSENTLSNNTASNNSNVCIILHNSSRNNLNSNNVSHSNYGIWLDSSSNSSDLNENIASYNKVGIYLKASNENVLNNNTVLNNSKYGISVWDSTSNELESNTAFYNEVSVLLHNASKNVLVGNIASNNNYGIWLGSLSSNNTFSSNEIASNSGYGICILSSYNNIIYDNYLNNTKNVYFDSKSSGNVWNMSKSPGTNIVGKPFLGGNLWASPNGNGFSQTHPDTDDDGICDTAYDMGKGNIDYLPLAGSF